MTTGTPRSNVVVRAAGAARAGLRWLGRKLFIDWRGEFSLGKAAIVFGLVNVWSLVWLYAIWIAYVTLSHQMTDAAPLAVAISGLVSAVGGSQLLVVCGQYVAKIWGSKTSGAETPPGDAAADPEPPPEAEPIVDAAAAAVDAERSE